MKHRSYALLLAAALSVSLLAGCGSQNNDQSSSGASSSSQSSQSVSSGSSMSTSGSLSGSASTSASAPDASQEENQQAKLTLSHTSLTLTSAGASATLKADGVPSGTKVTFKSGNTAVATVDGNGKVVAVKPGTAKITVTAGDQKATCVVTCKWEESKPSTGGSTTTGGSTAQKPSQPSQPSQPEQPVQKNWASIYSSAINAHGGEMVGYNPVFTKAETSMDSMILQSLGLNSSDMSAFAVSASMMNTKAYAIVAVMPAEGKQSAVLQALQNYIAQKQSEFEFYLPDQKVVADAAKVGVLSNGTVLLVMNEGQDAIYSAIAGAIQAG